MDKIDNYRKSKCQFEILLYSIFSIMCLVIPTGLNWLKGIILIGVLCVLILKKKLITSFSNIIFVLSLVIISIFFYALGIINNAPGASVTLKVHLLYPIIYFLLYLYMKKIEKPVNIEKILKFSLVIIVLDLFIFILYSYRLFPFYFKFPNNAYGINNENFEVSIKSMGSLIFLIPYYISDIFYKKEYKLKRILFLLILVIIAFFSGRDILWITLIFTIFFLAKDYLSKIKNIKKVLVIFLFIMLFLFFYFFFSGILIEKILMKVSSSERLKQFKVIISYFLEKPFLGYGSGSVVPSMIRDPKQPWAYEYVYLKYLFDYGILGTAFYMLILFLPIIIGYRYKKYKKELYPLLIGYLMLLIANATNPYFGKLDYLNLYLLIFLKISYCRRRINYERNNTSRW